MWVHVCLCSWSCAGTVGSNKSSWAPPGEWAALPAPCPQADSLGWLFPSIWFHMIGLWATWPSPRHPWPWQGVGTGQSLRSLPARGRVEEKGEGWNSRVKGSRGCWSSFALSAAPECIILAAGKQSSYHVVQDFLMDVKPKPAESFSQKGQILTKLSNEASLMEVSSAGL